MYGVSAVAHNRLVSLLMGVFPSNDEHKTIMDVKKTHSCHV